MHGNMPYPSVPSALVFFSLLALALLLLGLTGILLYWLSAALPEYLDSLFKTGKYNTTYQDGYDAGYLKGHNDRVCENIFWADMHGKSRKEGTE